MQYIGSVKNALLWSIWNYYENVLYNTHWFCYKMSYRTTTKMCYCSHIFFADICKVGGQSDTKYYENVLHVLNV